MMLQIVVEVADTMCGAGFAVFSRTVDRLPPVDSNRQFFSSVGGNISSAANFTFVNPHEEQYHKLYLQIISPTGIHISNNIQCQHTDTKLHIGILKTVE